MPKETLLARLDVLIWTLVYGGLFMLVLGIASHDETAIGGWSLSVVGLVVAAVGAVLVVVRARITEPPAGAQSKKQVPENKQ